MIYNHIRSIKKSSSIPPTVLYKGVSATENTDKASEYLFTTFNFELPANPDHINSTVRRHLLSIQNSEQEVLDALISLCTDKATGIDGIGPRIRKQCA